MKQLTSLQFNITGKVMIINFDVSIYYNHSFIIIFFSTSRYLCAVAVHTNIDALYNIIHTNIIVLLRYGYIHAYYSVSFTSYKYYFYE